MNRLCPACNRRAPVTHEGNAIAAACDLVEVWDEHGCVMDYRPIADAVPVEEPAPEPAPEPEPEPEPLRALALRMTADGWVTPANVALASGRSLGVARTVLQDMVRTGQAVMVRGAHGHHYAAPGTPDQPMTRAEERRRQAATRTTHRDRVLAVMGQGEALSLVELVARTGLDRLAVTRAVWRLTVQGTARRVDGGVYQLATTPPPVGGYVAADVWRLLEAEPLTVEEVAGRAGLSRASVWQTLTRLRASGRVVERGGRFVVVS